VVLPLGRIAGAITAAVRRQYEAGGMA